MAIRFELTREHIRDADCEPLTRACSHGQLHIVRWLVERFRLAARDVRVVDNEAFACACINGQLAVAQWLAERFRLTTRDACVGHNDAIVSACLDGHIEVAQWLTRRFGLGREGARVGYTCPLGHITDTTVVALKWLTVTFGLRRRGADHLYHVLVNSAADENHEEFAWWIVKRFGIMPHDARSVFDAYEYIADITEQQVTRAQRWFDAFAAEW